jgi:hypothetical protein
VTLLADTQNGWAVGGAGTILHTSDGGSTWSPQSSGYGRTIYSVTFLDAQNGWVAGQGRLIASNNDVATLFNGAVFTIVVDGTEYSLTSTATVALDGTIIVSMRMSQGLQNALLTALSEGTTVDFSLSALSNDGDYSIAADAISRLISQGKLKFAVV